MAASSLLSLPISPCLSRQTSLNTTTATTHHRHHCHQNCGLRATIRGSVVRARAQLSIGGRTSKLLCRDSDFSGLRENMSSGEGLQKRARDPQLAADKAKDRVGKTRANVGSQVSKPGVKSLVVFVGIPLILGSVDALFNSPLSKWFADLKKPWWEPPGPIFGGAWSVLYPIMGLASWLVWAEGGFSQQSYPLTLYAVQLVLNLLWPVFFFGRKQLGLALVDILLLDVVLAATVHAFMSVNELAGRLMKPYLAWVLFATLLNFNLWLNNRSASSQQAA